MRISKQVKPLSYTCNNSMIGASITSIRRSDITNYVLWDLALVSFSFMHCMIWFYSWNIIILRIRRHFFLLNKTVHVLRWDGDFKRVNGYIYTIAFSSNSHGDVIIRILHNIFRCLFRQNIAGILIFDEYFSWFCSEMYMYLFIAIFEFHVLLTVFDLSQQHL